MCYEYGNDCSGCRAGRQRAAPQSRQPDPASFLPRATPPLRKWAGPSFTGRSTQVIFTPSAVNTCEDDNPKTYWTHGYLSPCVTLFCITVFCETDANCQTSIPSKSRCSARRPDVGEDLYSDCLETPTSPVV